MKLDTYSEILANQTVIQFMLEIFLANELSRQPQEATDAFKTDLLDRFRYNMTAPDSSDDTMRIAQRTVEIAEHLVGRVADREADIRSAR